MKNICIFICVFSIGFCVFSQTEGETPYSLPSIVPPAPDVHNFQKYGDIPVGYYTGIPQINIPLYEITTRTGVSIPIALKYHAGGIKVDDMASRIGLGWSLAGEGMISRTISGMPDFTGAFNKPNLNTFNPNDATNNYSDQEYANSVLRGESDSQPDIFSYNFLNRSGKFVFDNTRKIHLIPQEAIKVEAAANMNSFEITDESGNVFLFNRTSVSYVTSNCPTPLTAIESQFNHSWKLTQIKTPQGEEVNFKYRNFNYSYRYANEYTEYIKGENQFGCPGKAPVSCEKTIHHSESVLEEISFTAGKVSFIYSDNIAYPIAGSAIRKDLPGNHALRKVNITNAQGQQVKSYTLNYDYFITHQGATDPNDFRLKLLSVAEVNAEKKHQFIYEETIKLPKRLSRSQDYWGYYNGSGNRTLLPTVFFGGNLVQGGNREVHPTKSQAGVLKKIIYPTGGSSEFIYEPNDYFSTEGKEVYTSRNEVISSVNGSNYVSSNDSFEITAAYQGITIQTTMSCENNETVFDAACSFKIFDSSNQQISFIREPGEYDFNPGSGIYRIQYEYVGDTCDCATTMKWTETTVEGQNTNVLAGGLRVKKIKNDDGIQTEETLYGYHHENSTRSSGMVQGKPILSHVSIEPGGTLGSCTYLKVNYSSVYPIATALGNSVGYSNVTVYKNNTNDHGRSVYTYTNATDAIHKLLNNPMPITSFDWRRGLLLSSTMYTNSGDIVYKETNTYDFDYRFISNSSESYSSTSLISGLVIVGTQGNPSINTINREFEWATYDITSAWVKPISTSKEQFFPEKVTEQSTYYYDNPNHLQRTRTETTDSDQKLITQKITYPLDLSNPTAAEQQLITEHQLTAPIQIETSKGAVKNTQHTEYTNTKWFGNVLPEYIKSQKGNIDTENRIVYHKYDAKGNPLEVSKANGIHSIYIWGYDDMYPIAKINNASYTGLPIAIVNLIAEIRTLSDTENSEAKENQLREHFESLRNDPHFKASQISSYTHDPLIGVTSMTDPKGYTMYYFYDDFNRLETIKDDAGKLISEHKYHYKSE